MEKINTEITSYETLNNGFLKIPARVYREGVYGIAGENIGSDKEFVNVFYPMKEFSSKETVSSLETSSVVDGHSEIDLSNKNEASGHVTGAASIDGGDIYCDLLITDKSTIQKIKDKEVSDVSVFFSGKYVENRGVYDGKEYDGVFCDINFNHVALLPKGSGRMGTDVKIFNSGNSGNEREKKTMPEITTLEDMKLALEKATLLNEDNSRKIAELTAQNEELKKTAEENIDEQIKKASEDNKKAESIDDIAETKIANSGLHGVSLYKAGLQAFGIETKNASNESLEFAYNAVSKASEKISSAKNTRDVKVSNSNSELAISSGSLNYLDDKEFRLRSIVNK